MFDYTCYGYREIVFDVYCVKFFTGWDHTADVALWPSGVRFLGLGFTLVLGVGVKNWVASGLPRFHLPRLYEK